MVEAQPVLTSEAPSAFSKGKRLGSNLGLFGGKGSGLEVGEEELFCLMYGWNHFLEEETDGISGVYLRMARWDFSSFLFWG